MEIVFPAPNWNRCPPERVDMHAEKLAAIEPWLHNVMGDRPYRGVNDT